MVQSSAIDSGYSWVILFSAFFTNALFCTYSTSGVLFVEFRRYFELSSVVTSGINTTESVIFTITCFVAGALIHRYGCRRIAIVATIFGGVSYLGGAFVPEFGYLYFTYGVLCGLAGGLVWVNGQVIVQQYFNRRRALASSLFMTALSIAGAGYPPLTQFLIDTYGWRGTLLLLGGCWIQILPLAALLRPHKSTTKSSLIRETFRNGTIQKAVEAEISEEGPHDAHTTESHKKLPKITETKCFAIVREIFDTALIFRAEFIVYSLFRMSSVLVRVVPDYFLPACAISSGVGKMQAAFLVTIVGIAQIVTRPIAGFLNDYLQSDRVIVCSVSGMVSGIVLVSAFFMWHHIHFVVYSALIGISTGIFSAIEIPVGVDLIGQEKLAHGFGIVSFMQGVMLIVSLPVSAALADMTHSFKPIFLLCGISKLCICGLFFLVVFLTRRRQSQKDESVEVSLQCEMKTVS